MSSWPRDVTLPPEAACGRLPPRGAPLADWQSQIRGGRLRRAGLRRPERSGRAAQ